MQVDVRGRNGKMLGTSCIAPSCLLCPACSGIYVHNPSCLDLQFYISSLFQIFHRESSPVRAIFHQIVTTDLFYRFRLRIPKLLFKKDYHNYTMAPQQFGWFYAVLMLRFCITGAGYTMWTCILQRLHLTLVQNGEVLSPVQVRA